MTSSRNHWQQVYSTKSPNAVSWYQPVATRSLQLIGEVAPDRATPLIDVGAGASTLVDGLLESGYREITVLDIAEPALDLARARLGQAAEGVHWVVADVLEAELPESAWGVWHDRAAFHFLTDPADRKRYREQLHRSLRAGGHAIIATFAVDGPPRCSGLDVQRWEASGLVAELGGGFSLVNSFADDHVKPDGGVQRFCWCVMRLGGSAR